MKAIWFDLQSESGLLNGKSFVSTQDLKNTLTGAVDVMLTASDEIKE